MKTAPETGQGSLTSYGKGFLLSIILTLAAYLTVTHHHFDGKALVAFIIGLAIIQLMVQLIFFLHLGKGSKARWNIIVMLFALMVILILVIGSLWIMYNLNYNMTSNQMNNYVQNQSDGGV